ncbi:hypothetical protein CLV78_1257 [Aliiruegeria haliotis]|uniref:Uncharacterized protein n=1 Tax=Aliiruegeria haliotis TaxID=1280846 RepID=A0A2T0RDR2_9RHOB|nr:hypothetical protein [Aliiruegeria haliotis]PRY19291.1 hypothetical protein CLV78_1257 [Aliiruegeria haliotis]
MKITDATRCSGQENCVSLKKRWGLPADTEKKNSKSLDTQSNNPRGTQRGKTASALGVDPTSTDGSEAKNAKSADGRTERRKKIERTIGVSLGDPSQPSDPQDNPVSQAFGGLSKN